MEHLRLTDSELSPPDLTAVLEGQGIRSVIISAESDLETIESHNPPQLALLDMSAMPASEIGRCIQRSVTLKLPVIVLVPEEQVANLDMSLGFNDFVTCPLQPDELVARAKKIVWRTASPDGSDVVRIGDLVINSAKYEVSVKGRRVNLRFKEYELLRFLADNPGRVYTRESLLSQIWDYDYLGGTRTVDVHIRRLRSKIEDAEHSFIETIWGLGYRFRDLGTSS